MTRRDVVIVGAGMTPFGRYAERTLQSLGGEAIDAALADAGMERAEIDMAFVANSMASIVTGQVAIVGQTILRASGFAGIPVFNIDNACASSSSALNLAVQAIRAGAAQAVLVLGVEKLVSADKTKAYLALNGAVDIEFLAESGVDPAHESVFVKAVYPKRLDAYADLHGLDADILAAISVKNRGHAAANVYAQYRKPISVEEVLASRQVAGPVTALMCAPIGDGAAAVIVTRADRATSSRRPVAIAASAIGMGGPPSLERSVALVARRAYADAGISPPDIDVAEVHDSTAFNELLAYEELGFAEAGGAAQLIRENATAIGGRIPVNPSGGLESRGHPVAATGLAQVVELVTQLRNDAGERQVAGARYALAENAGGFARDDTAAIAITILTN